MRPLLLSGLVSAALLAGSEAVLWRDPGPVERLDLAGGPGGRNKAPKPPFTFLEEEAGGTAAKVSVRDADGVRWSVKFGEEVKAENFSSRIVWAAGYFAEPTYYVREGKIDGARSLGRAAAFIKNGEFHDARFEIRDNTIARPVPGSKWSLESPELRGSRELAGLKVLLLLLSNWDIKAENMAIMEANGRRYYAVTDWGATMGRASDITGRSKWDCESYSRDSNYLIDGVENGFVIFNYQGKESHAVPREIRPEHVQWLMRRLGRLSDAQVDAALKASGATTEEAACFGKAFRNRLAHFMAIKEGSPEGVVTRSRREIKIIRKQQPQ